MRLDELDKKITQSDLDALEIFADRIFGKVGIDVEFTRHFLDRVNDDRNGEQITGSELTRLFKQEYKRWGKPIAQMGPDAEAVMKDLQTDINMPFALRWDRDNNELDLIVKTVMRKKDFKTSNKEFPVESIEEDREESPSATEMKISDLTISDAGMAIAQSVGGGSRTDAPLAVTKLPSGHVYLVNGYHRLVDAIQAGKDTVSVKYVPYEKVEILWKQEREQDIKYGKQFNELSEWNWRQPFSFPRPDVVGKPLPSKDSYGREDVKTIELPIGLAPGKLNASKKSKRNEEVNEDSQIWEWNKEDPNNPEVLIQGYGRLMLNQIEDSVVRKLAELTKMAERGDFEQIQSLLDRDVMQTMMKAIVDTKAELQSTRKRGGPKSRGINKESILDVIGRSEIEELDEESPWELFKRKVDPTIHNNRYQKAAERLHSVLQRKEKENNGKWRHALGWYVSKIADGFNGVNSRALEDYYLKNFDSVFEEINETGGVGKVVPGVNTTIDVGPDEIKKQAAKFGNKVSKDGLPKNTFR
jgi:hypothetical protein